MFYRFLLAIALTLGFASAAQAEINTDTGCDSSGAWMLQTGFTVSGSKCVGADVRSMKMLMQMTSSIKKGHKYRVTFTLSGYSGSGAVRAFVGITMPSAPTGSWVDKSTITPVADRFSWGVGHGIITSGPDFVSHCIPYDSPATIHNCDGKTTGLTGPGTSGEGIGSMRLFCTHAKFGWIDPVLTPDFVGGHIHEFIGNTDVQPDWVYNDFRTKGSSSCQDARSGQAQYPINPSGYWFPALIEDRGTAGVFVVKESQTLIYYKGPAAPQGVIDYTGLPATAEGAQYMCNEEWGMGDGGTGTGLRSDGGVADLYHDQLGNPVTDDVRCPQYPPGMKFIFGFNKADPTNTQTDNDSGVASPAFAYGAIDYSCWAGPNGEGGAVGGQTLPISTVVPGYHSFPELEAAIAANPTLCPIGAQIHVGLGAPECWDGKHVDSPNHRDHVSYATGTTAHVGNVRCPPTHPYPLPHLSLQNYYTVDQALLDGKWRWSIDEMVDGLTRGTGAHMDYVFAWSPTASAKWYANCVHVHNACTNDLGDGTHVPGPLNYDGTQPFCNGCAKARPDRLVSSTDLGMSRSYQANGTYTVDLVSPGDGVFGFMGLEGFNGSLDDIQVSEISQGGHA
jgi:hypothetical protein